MKKLNSFQVCHVAGKGKDSKVLDTYTTHAETLADAYTTAQAETAAQEHAAQVVTLVYPLATLDNGETIVELADYVRRQFWKWELRNSHAVLSALNRSTWDEQDEQQTAAAAIVETMVERPGATMWDCYRAARAALDSERDKLFRKSEVEYMPGVMFCNPFREEKPRATYPRLARLIAQATEAAGLTDKQAEVLDMYQSGTTCAAALELLGITKRSYYQNLYVAFFKVLDTAATMDGDGVPTFQAAGITAQDVADALEAYAKRARVRR